MKSERLLSILLLLQARPKRTARELARTLEVSERTIYRDVESLSIAGVPVYASRGNDGGIALSEGYRRALTHFDEDEVRALFVSGASPLADIGFESGRALEKLRGMLSDTQRRAAEYASARILVDQRRWTQDAVPRTILATLRRAIWDDRRVRIAYGDRSGAVSTRAIDPLGLVSKAGVWYTVARDGESYRSFRVNRITDIHELDEHFERPAGFDLGEHWQQSTESLMQQWPSSYDVALRVRSDDLATVCSYFTGERISERNGEVLVRMRFPAPDIALQQVIAWGEKVTVVEPAALCERLVECAREIVERYAEYALRSSPQSTMRRKSAKTLLT